MLWFVLGGMLLSIGLILFSVISTALRKEEGPLEQIFARQEKMNALIESAKIWENIGLRHEAEACIDEAKRLSTEVQAILQGENS